MGTARNDFVQITRQETYETDFYQWTIEQSQALTECRAEFPNVSVKLG